MSDELVSQTEASIMLNVSISTVEKMRQRGILQTVRIGRTVRIPLFQIERICHKQNLPGLKSQDMELGGSIIQKMDEANDKALGRKIRKRRNLG